MILNLKPFDSYNPLPEKFKQRSTYPNLSDLAVLALDCQATGANPARGHLLEMGWTRTSATLNNVEGRLNARSYLVSLPPNAAVPPAVQRITGISEEDLKTAVTSKTVWRYLLASAGSISSGNPGAACPIVIHFARYEEPFLRDLHRDNDPSGPFPFRIICTHEIALRLLPDLPRRGLRAIAGYYGHCMPELKRSAEHAVATAFVWLHMVQLLKNTCGIVNMNQLFDWLANTKPAGRTKRVFPMNPELRQKLPDKPGIYRMLLTGGDLLYIGKAKSLKQRVNSYFRQKAPHAEHILEMLTQARKLDFAVTGSALEAAVLESDEIKRRSPPYNIALRRRQRQLAFCAKDLAGYAAHAGNDNPVGPLPGGRTIEALTAFGWWYSNGIQKGFELNRDIGCSILALPPEFAPELNCMAEGFESFLENHHRRLRTLTPLRFLTGLGAKLWQDKLQAEALAVTEGDEKSHPDDDDDHQDKSDDLPAWTPETVVSAIESMIRHSAHLIRRARWYCMLSESSVAWTSIEPHGSVKNLIIFERGAVVEQKRVEPTAETAPPPGHTNSFRTRQGNIDLITYDRMRVLTTEIRRIVSEGRDVELRLRPNVCLGRRELIKALKWI